MNKYLIAALLLLTGISNHSFASSKIYIDSNDVMIGKNGIFVKVEGYIYNSQGIYHDNIGTYLYDLDMKRCDDCGRDYPAYERDCPYTGAHDTDHDNNENNS